MLRFVDGTLVEGREVSVSMLSPHQNHQSASPDSGIPELQWTIVTGNQNIYRY